MRARVVIGALSLAALVLAASTISSAPSSLSQQPTARQQDSDVGLLLGLRENRVNVEDRESHTAYETVWITWRGDRVEIQRASNLLIPRTDDFWLMGNALGAEDQRETEYLWAAPLDRQPKRDEVLRSPACEKGSSVETVDSVFGDYVGISQVTTKGCKVSPIKRLLARKMSEVNDGPNRAISEVLGADALSRFEIAVETKRHSLLAELREKTCTFESDPAQWDVTRPQQRWEAEKRWAISGSGIYSPDSCSDEWNNTFEIPARLPSEFIEDPPLPLPWVTMQAAFPNQGFSDALSSPSGKFVILVALSSYDELAVCPVKQGRLSDPVAQITLGSEWFDVEISQVVMERWARGDDVRLWGEAVARIQRTQSKNLP